MKEMLGGCCVCADENGWEANPLVYCDGPNCEVAVHQGCYGIIEVPEGEWYCAKCTDMLTHLKLSGGDNVMDIHDAPRCELCPFGHGALKRTDSGGWAHVICALYIPEVRFGDVHSMDPVIIGDVPLERFQQPCYLCTERGDRKQALQGACMSCNKLGCKKVFHVTCAQAEGLLCEEGAGSKNVKYCGYCSSHAKKAIADPLIKVIPPYRHREQSSSCSSTTSGGGQQFSPHFSSSYNGNIATTDGFISRRLTLNASPLNSAIYGNSHLSSVTPLSATSSHRILPVSASVSDASGLRNGGAMLVDPLHRTPLPPTSVDKAMMNAMMSQPIVGQTLLDGSCCSPISSGRSSTAQDSSPPAAPSVSLLKHDQHLNTEIRASSASGVPLPSNMSTMMTSNIVKDELKPLLHEGPLNNGNIPTFSGAQPSVSSVFGAPDIKVAPVPRAVKRPRGAQVGEKIKKPRNNNRTNRSMKTLLESVGPLVSETVSDFQRERVNERDAAAAAAASSAAHMEAPSTSGEGSIVGIRLPNNFQTGSGTLTGVLKMGLREPQPSTSGICMPSTSTLVQDTARLCGVPLLRSLPKGLSSPETTQPSSSVDRIHVSTSGPSTSFGFGGVGGIQHGPLPQTLEELLERQWEQGSHFMMAHAPFDVAQLLSCLHELKKENVRLEGELNGLVRRRDHLLAVNAQLSLNLTGPSASTSSPNNSPRVNGSTTVTASLGATSSPTAAATMPHSTTPSLQQTTSSTSSRVLGTPSASPVSIAFGTLQDDSLNKLRTLTANSGHTATVRSGSMSAGTQQLPTTTPPIIGRPSSRQTNGQQAGFSGTLQQSPLANFSQTRIPSTASANSIPHVSTPSSVSGSSAVTNPKPSLMGSSELVATGGSATTISPERQQQLAAAAIATALNPLNGNFLPRAHNPLNTATAAGNLGQFAPQDILTQYALLQHQMLQQQVAAAALRYGGIVMSGSSTPPTSGASTQATSGQSGK